MRKPEYQAFLDHTSGRSPDELPKDIEFAATPEEEGWQRQRQVAIAINRKRRGLATDKQLDIVAEKTTIVVSEEDYLRALKRKRAADHANELKFYPRESSTLYP